jgi:hypothetical protein
MDPIGGTDREERPIPADFYVDVTPVFDTKRQMLAEHRSQRDWLLRHHGIDNYLLQMEEWTRARGRLAGIELAEGFRQYRGHAYPLTPALQELVAAHCGDTSIHTPNSGPWRALPDRTGTCYEPVHTASVAARKRSQADGPSEDDTPINFQEFNYLTA